MTNKSKEVRDELTFNASDNDDNPESPEQLLIEQDITLLTVFCLCIQ